MTDYKAGTIAVATVRGTPDVRVMAWGGSTWISGVAVESGHAGPTRIHTTHNVTDIRPLVVLDPDDYDSVRNVVQMSNYLQPGALVRDLTKAMQVGLKSLLPPPAIPEPKGWGAVIEDSRGRYWTLINPAEGIWSESTGSRSQYDRLSPVRIVTEGVPR